MRKMIACALALIIVASLAGCVQVPRRWEFLHDADSIVAIEIYNLTEYIDFDLPEDAEPIAYVKQEDYASFCEDIASIEFSDEIILFPAAIDPSWTLHGYVAKIIYDNGDYELINNSGYQSQEVINGRGRSFHYSFPDDVTWVNLIQKHIDVTAS